VNGRTRRLIWKERAEKIYRGYVERGTSGLPAETAQMVVNANKIVLTLIPFAASVALYYLARGGFIVAIMLGAVSFFLPYFPFSLRNQHPEMRAHIVLGIGATCLLILTVFYGYSWRYILPLFTVLPIVAVVLIGVRPALFWAFMTSLMQSTLGAMFYLSGLSTVKLPPDAFTLYFLHGCFFFMVTMEMLMAKSEAVQHIREVRESKMVIERHGHELEKARDLAVAASRRKDEFLSNVSHEIRTPLNAVLGMSELLLDHKLTSICHRYVQSIQSSGESLLRVVNDIIDLSKIENGRIDIDNVDFRLQDTVWDVRRLFEGKAREKCIFLECKVLAHVPEIVAGDPVRLRQILANLVSNAVKFTGRGGVTICAREARRKGQREEGVFWARFEVVDTGVGLSPEQQVSVFRPYVQANESVSRSHGGTGLGLAICRQLTDLMGGVIGVESMAGKGATFWFELPFEVTPSGYTVKEDAGDGPDCLVGRRAIVAHADSLTRNLLGRHLRSWGMEVEESADGESALLMLADFCQTGDQFPLALLAAHLPGQNGLAIAKQVSDVPARFGRPVVLLLESGPRLDETDERDRNDVAGTLSLPVSAGIMRDLIMRAVRTRLDRVLLEPGDVVDPGDNGEKELDLFVMVVEDNQVNRRIALAQLSKLGCAVVSANNGAEALEVFQREGGKVDLILMDCQMPVMDGFEATRGIRHQEIVLGRNPVSIIAMTANVMAQDLELCRAAGMDDHLAKPYTCAQLRLVLEHWRPRRSAVFSFLGPGSGSQGRKKDEENKHQEHASSEGFVGEGAVEKESEFQGENSGERTFSGDVFVTREIDR